MKKLLLTTIIAAMSIGVFGQKLGDEGVLKEGMIPQDSTTTITYEGIYPFGETSKKFTESPVGTKFLKKKINIRKGTLKAKAYNDYDASGTLYDSEMENRVKTVKTPYYYITTVQFEDAKVTIIKDPKTGREIYSEINIKDGPWRKLVTNRYNRLYQGEVDDMKNVVEYFAERVPISLEYINRKNELFEEAGTTTFTATTPRNPTSREHVRSNTVYAVLKDGLLIHTKEIPIFSKGQGEQTYLFGVGDDFFTSDYIQNQDVSGDRYINWNVSVDFDSGKLGTSTEKMSTTFPQLIEETTRTLREAQENKEGKLR